MGLYVGLQEEAMAADERQDEAIKDRKDDADLFNNTQRAFRTELDAVNGALGKDLVNKGEFAALKNGDGKTWKEALNALTGRVEDLEPSKGSVTPVSGTGPSSVGIVVPPPVGSVVPPPSPVMPPPPSQFEIVARRPHCYIVRCKRRRIFIQCDAYNGTILYRQWVPRPGCVCATPHGDWVPVTAPW